MIAHRLSTIRDADIIAVVAGGKIVEVCKVKMNGCAFRESSSAVFIFVFLFKRDKLLQERNCSIGINSFLNE